MEGRRRDLSLYGGKDPRDLPIYTIGEAAHILWLPLSTLKTWTFGKQWHDPSGKARTYVPLIIPPETSDQLMLSFTNLIEAHVLQAIRRVHKIAMSKVREAMKELRRDFTTLHPLAEVDLYTEGRNILVRYSGYVNMSAGKQIEMEQAINIYIKRIDRDEGKIARFYPFAGEPRIKGPGIEEQPRMVSVDPFVSFGRPVIAGTNIRTEIIAERWWAGDSMDELAKEYQVTRTIIEAAVRYETPRPLLADADATS